MKCANPAGSAWNLNLAAEMTATISTHSSVNQSVRIANFLRLDLTVLMRSPCRGCPAHRPMARGKPIASRRLRVAAIPADPHLPPVPTRLHVGLRDTFAPEGRAAQRII
jgi:hypothetical protein